MIGEDIYNGLYANTDLRGTITTAQGLVVTCLCSGIQTNSDQGELGQLIAQTANVRILTAHEVDGLSINDRITVADSSANEHSVRITGRKRTAGMTTLTIEAVNA